MRPLLVLPAVVLLAAGCTNGTAPEATTPAVATPVVGKATTWEDGTSLRGTVTIPAGSTVILARGAHVTAARGSKVHVLGTLTAAGARISGTDWAGLSVGPGGSASLEGLRLEGAGVATEKGAEPVSLTSVSISHASYPFMIATGTSVAMRSVTVDKVGGPSVVRGTLVADRLDYDKGGNTGIVVSGASSVLRLTRSSLVGNGKFEGDMLNTSSAGELTVSDTVLRDNHCAFHLVGVRRLTLTKVSVHDNAYGFMAYGSDPAQTHRITNTDVYDNREYGLFENPSTVQGIVLVDGGFWGRNGDHRDIVQITGKIVRTRPASSPAS